MRCFKFKFVKKNKVQLTSLFCYLFKQSRIFMSQTKLKINQIIYSKYLIVQDKNTGY